MRKLLPIQKIEDGKVLLASISEGIEMVYVSGTFGCNGQGARGTIAFALSFFPI